MLPKGGGGITNGKKWEHPELTKSRSKNRGDRERGPGQEVKGDCPRDLVGASLFTVVSFFMFGGGEVEVHLGQGTWLPHSL